VLDNSNGQAFTEKPFFNKTFIKANKIKSIDGTYNYKKAGQAMIPTKYHSVYQFDDEGNLSATFETRTDDGTKDTTWNKYEYDNSGRLAVHKRGDKNGMLAVHYFFDEKNRIIKEEYWKESLDSLNRAQKPILQNTETMKYDEYTLQQKKTVFNSYDLPYNIEYKYFNIDGYLSEREDRILMTSKMNKYTYFYDEHGFIESIKTFKNNDKLPHEELKFSYDAFGNVTQKNLYINGEYVTETAILYNSKTNLMSSVIIRDVKSSYIMAIRFLAYTYYE